MDWLINHKMLPIVTFFPNYSIILFIYIIYILFVPSCLPCSLHVDIRSCCSAKARAPFCHCVFHHSYRSVTSTHAILSLFVQRMSNSNVRLHCESRQSSHNLCCKLIFLWNEFQLVAATPGL